MGDACIQLPERWLADMITKNVIDSWHHVFHVRQVGLLFVALHKRECDVQRRHKIWTKLDLVMNVGLYRKFKCVNKISVHGRLLNLTGSSKGQMYRTQIDAYSVRLDAKMKRNTDIYLFTYGRKFCIEHNPNFRRDYVGPIKSGINNGRLRSYFTFGKVRTPPKFGK